jgi:hypothetical protein
MHLVSTLFATALLLQPFSDAASTTTYLRKAHPTTSSDDAELTKKEKATGLPFEIDTSLVIHGLMRDLGKDDLATVNDALIRAYNKVHGKDGDIMSDFIDLKVEMSDDKVESTSVLEDLGITRQWGYRVGSIYGNIDGTCQLCGNDDDTFFDESLSGPKGPHDPMSNMAAVEKMFCKLLTKSGEDNFKKIHDCSIKVGKFEVENDSEFIDVELA